MSKRKTYTEEFKTMIAELVLSGKSVKEVSAEYYLILIPFTRSIISRTIDVSASA